MIRPRVVGLLAALTLTAALGAVVPSAAHGTGPSTMAGQTQTIQFTSTPPSGVDWYTSRTFVIPQYVASATASSGLPVEYSIAPDSADVCTIREVYDEDDPGGPGAGVDFRGGGTCTILADQAGDDTYLSAPQASQSFQIERVRTWIDHVRARKGVPGSTPARFFATLRTWQFSSSHTTTVVPFPGQLVTFSVAGRPVCSGTTGTDGVATCKATLRRTELTRLRFTATYAGTDDYLPVSRRALFR